jgi:hypothetical protein
VNKKKSRCQFLTGPSGRRTTNPGFVTGVIQIPVPGVGEHGEWKDKLNNKHPGWKEVLKKVEKAPGRKAKNLY